MDKPKNTGTDVNRRDALKKLAKLSVYTAPAVTTMLASQASYAQGSCAIIDASRDRNDRRNPTANRDRSNRDTRTTNSPNRNNADCPANLP